MSVALGLAALLSIAGASAADAPAIDPAAQAVVERTRRTTATYSAYYWNWVRTAYGQTAQQWSAEFHRGSLHRVETPGVRVVADCAAMTGTALDVRTGATTRGPEVAGTACGINANRAVRRLALVRSADSRFGPADTVDLFDGEHERFYVVDGDGVLVASEYFAVEPGNLQCLQMEATSVARALPEDDIFSEASLARSIVAEPHRSPPAGNYGDLWLGDRRCNPEP